MTCIVLHTVYYQCTYIAHFGAQQRLCQRETTTDTTGRWFFAICFLKGSLDSLCRYLFFSYALLPFPPGASQSLSATNATVTSATSPSPTIFVSTCASSATAPASYGSNQVAGLRFFQLQKDVQQMSLNWCVDVQTASPKFPYKRGICTAGWIDVAHPKISVRKEGVRRVEENFDQLLAEERSKYADPEMKEGLEPWRIWVCFFLLRPFSWRV